MIDASWRNDFHAYIGGVFRGLGAVPLSIGGVEDHVHCLIGIKTSQASGDLVREVKKASTAWAKERFVGFGWQEGYGVFSVSSSHVDAVRAYIERQEEHHRTVSSDDELRALILEHNIPIDERFFE